MRQQFPGKDSEVARGARMALLWIAPIGLGAAILIGALTAPDDLADGPGRPRPLPSASSSVPAGGGPAITRSATEDGWVRLQDPRGWSLRAPSYWPVDTASVDARCRGRHEALLTSNIQTNYVTSGDRCPTVPTFSGPSPEQVVIQIIRDESKAADTDAPPTRFPLNVADAEQPGAGTLQFEISRGQSYKELVMILYGRDADPAIVNTAARIVASITFG